MLEHSRRGVGGAEAHDETCYLSQQRRNCALGHLPKSAFNC